MSCCICRKVDLDRRKRILLFGTAKRAANVRNILASYLGDHGNRRITEGDLRFLFTEDYVCIECTDRIVEYGELKEKWRHAEQFMEEYVWSRTGEFQGLHHGQSPRRRPPVPMTSTPKRAKLQGESSLSFVPPVKVVKSFYFRFQQSEVVVIA